MPRSFLQNQAVSSRQPLRTLPVETLGVLYQDGRGSVCGPSYSENPRNRGRGRRQHFPTDGLMQIFDELADFLVVQCVHTERFGVISREARVLEMTRDVQHEDELFLLFGLTRVIST